MKCSYRNKVAAISDRQSFWFCNQNEDKHIFAILKLYINKQNIFCDYLFISCVFANEVSRYIAL